MTDNDVRDKFRRFSDRTLTQSTIERALDVLFAIEDVDDVRDALAPLLSP
jgi:hypothetical protein